MITVVSQKGEKMLISRQAAIDIERRATVDTNPEHFESHQKFVEFMDDAEISSFGRWQWSNGFNTALTAVGIDLKRLPSAQPERKKGTWIEMGTNTDGTHNIKCSKCGEGYKTRGHAQSFATKAKYKFCPNCGEDMRGDQNED